MNLYVNGFSVATSQDEDEVILHFIQKSPSFSLDGKIGEPIIEGVSDLIMNMETARNLAAVLQKLLDEAEEG